MSGFIRTLQCDKCRQLDDDSTQPIRPFSTINAGIGDKVKMGVKNNDAYGERTYDDLMVVFTCRVLQSSMNGSEDPEQPSREGMV